jgi:hypothetical protein
MGSGDSLRLYGGGSPLRLALFYKFNQGPAPTAERTLSNVLAVTPIYHIPKLRL